MSTESEKQDLAILSGRVVALEEVVMILLRYTLFDDRSTTLEDIKRAEELAEQYEW
mgnify:CR=1 FL=1